MSPVEMAPIGELMVSRSGTIDPSKFAEEQFDLYSVPAFDSRQPEILRGADIGSAKQLVRPGDVLLSKIVPHIRRAWVVGESRSRRLIASGEWIVFRDPRIDPAYLRQVVVGDPFHRQFMKTVAGIGGSLLRARPSEVAKIEIPLPAVAEQHRIARILDVAESLQTNRRRAIANLARYVEAMFLDMFGDAGTKGWPMVSIADLADAQKGAIRTGPFGSQLLHSEFVDEGVAVLGIDNAVANEFRWGQRRFITESKYRELKRYTVRPGDVLITIMGTCGRCAVVPDDIPLAINTKHLCCITLDPQKCSPAFLQSYFLHHPIARKYLHQNAKGTIMDGLNMGIIKAMPVPLVPLALQQRFARFVHHAERLKATYRRALANSGELFAVLQHRAFRGEL